MPEMTQVSKFINNPYPRLRKSPNSSTTHARDYASLQIHREASGESGRDEASHELVERGSNFNRLVGASVVRSVLAEDLHAVHAGNDTVLVLEIKFAGNHTTYARKGLADELRSSAGVKGALQRHRLPSSISRR